MQKYILKQQFEGFTISNTEGLHKGYDKSQVSLILRTKPGADSLNFDDLYNNLRVFESDVKGSTTSSSSPQNVAFVSENTSSTNEVSTAYCVPNPAGQNSQFKGNQDNRRRGACNSGTKDGSRTGKKEDSKALVTIDGEGVDWTNHSVRRLKICFDGCNRLRIRTQSYSCLNKCKESYANLKKLYDAQREQLSNASIEIKAYTQGLKKVEAQFIAHQQAQKEKEDLKAKVRKWHNSSKNLSKLLNTQMSANDKFGLGYGDHKYDGILSYENEVLQSVFMNKESELEKQPLYDRFVTAGGMHAVLPPMTGNYMPHRPDIEVVYSQFIYGPKQTQPSESESQTSEFDTCDSNISTEPSELVSEPVVNESNVECQPKVWSDAPIIEEYESDSEDEPFKKTTLLSTNVSKQKVNTAKDYPHRALKNKGIVDSGCSRHMTGNKAYLAEFQDFNGGPIAFGGSKGYITGKDFSNPFMVDNLPKIVGFSTHLSSLVKSWLVQDQTVLVINLHPSKLNMSGSQDEIPPPPPPPPSSSQTPTQQTPHTEEIIARERERKARTTLLMALPEDHLAKFHKMADAKEMWDAIKSRFGGNDESKKMQKYILK
ncbi:hypothetical protein Tco_0574177 [Tanacetum coccineum]